MKCADCIYSSWETEDGVMCETCRGFSNHKPYPPYHVGYNDELPGICPGTVYDNEVVNEVLVNVVAACDLVQQLNTDVVYGDGDTCNRAQGMLNMIKHAMTLTYEG